MNVKLQEVTSCHLRQSRWGDWQHAAGNLSNAKVDEQIGKNLWVHAPVRDLSKCQVGSLQQR